MSNKQFKQFIQSSVIVITRNVKTKNTIIVIPWNDRIYTM